MGKRFSYVSFITKSGIEIFVPLGYIEILTLLLLARANENIR